MSNREFTQKASASQFFIEVCRSSRPTPPRNGSSDVHTEIHAVLDARDALGGFDNSTAHILVGPQWLRRLRISLHAVLTVCM